MNRFVGSFIRLIAQVICYMLFFLLSLCFSHSFHAFLFLILFSFFSKQNICRSTTKECYQSERIFYVYKYIDRVSTLFGRNISSSRPLLVRIEFSNVDAFDIWLHNHRPLHRIEAKNDDFDYGLLYHDACSLSLENTTNLQAYDDVLAIEIKPKQGWDICTLPDFVLQIFEINHCLRDKCRFCAMQHLKVVSLFNIFRCVQRASLHILPN